MHLHQLLPLLAGFTRVVVTGPQRSGTTIAATILSRELGYSLILEEQFRERDIFRFINTLNNLRNCVVQAPALASIAHHLTDPDLAIVFMIRDHSEIILSERRIDWLSNHDAGERANYFISDGSIPIGVLKTQMWRKFQSCQLGGTGFELDYASLSISPLWVSKERRVNFGPRQTAP